MVARLQSESRISVGHPAEPEPPWLTRWAMEADLQIPQDLKNNVVFLGIKDGDRFVPKATAFFVGLHDKFGDILHLVTAEHVIANLRVKGCDTVYVRTNIPGFSLSAIPLDRWYFHPDAERTPTDVALIPVGIRGTTAADIQVLDVGAFVTPENFRDREWGVGDEVVAIGLFRNHYGRDKNIPIVRVGSLAALPDEPVKTDWGFIEAYLIELHSIGGLSGSPVYIHHPPFRIQRNGNPQVISGPRLNLLGIMQGHFDVANLREDSVVDDDTADPKRGSINTGIGVVIPAYKIIETLNHPDLKAERDELIARAERGAASLDMDEKAPPSDDGRP